MSASIEKVILKAMVEELYHDVENIEIDGASSAMIAGGKLTDDSVMIARMDILGVVTNTLIVKVRGVVKLYTPLKDEVSVTTLVDGELHIVKASYEEVLELVEISHCEIEFTVRDIDKEEIEQSTPAEEVEVKTSTLDKITMVEVGIVVAATTAAAVIGYKLWRKFR